MLDALLYEWEVEKWIYIEKIALCWPYRIVQFL